ncbi:MAG: YbjQ family protein [Planctomycetota bacterium]
MELIVELLFFLVPLVVCGLIIGRMVEKNHFAELDRREAANRNFLVTNSKTYPDAAAGFQEPAMVTSEVVIGSDYLKSFLSGWRGIFGGEMKSLQALQVRAKREAIARLIDQARAQGYNAICNLRVDGITVVGATKQNNKMLMASVLATATAYHAMTRGSGTSSHV